MDFPQLQALIQRSTLITNEERAYWLQTLPYMTPEHMTKLEGILTAGENIHLEDKVKQYFTAVAQSKAAQPPIAS